VTTNPGEDDSEAGGLDEEDSETADRAIAALFKRVGFNSIARQAFEKALGMRSVAAIVGVRNSKPFIELVPSKWAEPKFLIDGKTLERLEIRYPYLQPKRERDGKWKVDVLLYRRVIDTES